MSAAGRDQRRAGWSRLVRESWGCLTRPCCTRRLTQVEKGHRVLEKEGVKNIASRLSRREDA